MAFLSSHFTGSKTGWYTLEKEACIVIEQEALCTEHSRQWTHPTCARIIIIQFPVRPTRGGL